MRAFFYCLSRAKSLGIERFQRYTQRSKLNINSLEKQVLKALFLHPEMRS
jgi:hypothetical protein